MKVHTCTILNEGSRPDRPLMLFNLILQYFYGFVLDA